MHPSRNRLMPSWFGPMHRSHPLQHFAFFASLYIDPWINNAVEKIGQQLPRECQHAKEQSQPHDRWIVTLPYALEEQSAHTRPSEDLFDNHRATEKSWQR